MRLSGLFILAGALFGLSACRANNPPAPQSSEAPAVATATRTPDTRPLIVCFGDSLTAGFGADPGSSYPDYLQQDLDAAGYHYRVVNEGVSGNTTKDGVERLSVVVAMKAAVVIVEFGGNDGLRGLKIQNTRDNLAKIVATLKTSGARVVLAGITLPPDYGRDYIQQFTGIYTAVGKQYDIPVLPFLLQNVYGVEGMMQPDRTHATSEGNEVVATNVLPYVLPLIKK